MITQSIPKGVYPTTRSGKIKISSNEKSNTIPIFLIGLAGLCIISLTYLNLDWAKLISRLPDIGKIFYELAHFEFTKWDVIGTAMLETLTITILSTIYGIVAGLVLAIFAARNIFRVPGLAVCVKLFATFLRAVPTPIWVLMMMVCIGMGTTAGIAGLSIHTVAFFTKVFSESFENISSETLEALEATGVGRLGIFMNAVLPSAMAQIVAWSGMRFEINFSECTILGMIGAGGIGYIISTGIQGYDYGTAGLSIFLVFLFAYAIERIFVAVKKIIQ